MGEKLLGGVIWDLDGVLSDNAPLHYRAWEQALREHGVEFDPTVIRRTFGQNNHSILVAVLGDSWNAAAEESIATRKEELFREMARAGVEPLPGAVEWLRRLHGWGWRQAIGSSAPMENIEVVLEGLGVRGYFDALCSGDGLPAGKPDPAIFLMAAERLGLPPERCIVVEDAPAGVEAARRGGMRCIAVTTSRPASELADADVVVENLALLPEDTFARLLGRG